jgi:hypothetical protein
MEGPRIAVTVGGVLLIAFILWFFFGRRARDRAWPARRDGHITPSTSPPASRDSG